MHNLDRILNQIRDRIHEEADWGLPAQYIPELANVAPEQFAISVVTSNGQCCSAGQADRPFSIQSISKVFSLVATLGRIGEALWTRVGREPTRAAFDSIMLLETDNGRPPNPFVNAGAIVTTDALLAGREPRQALAEILGLIRTMAGRDDIYINKRVAQSEKRTAERNKALAHYLASHGNLLNDPDLTLGTYFHQCAIEMTTVQLAMSGRVLAGLDCAPPTISRTHARRTNALMMTCGHYDASGEFAFKVGLPGKSGVGGGILLIAPRRASIAIWSPGLNGYGNSQAGTRAATMLAELTGWSVF
ncbi:glutaminase [Methyloceanibacter sp.]|uniref:glutaminase n=1 Tax=Methyloceanibacter sp. TaxID=1965321 RepID=UPI002087C7C1|nr:glutaminase [Methyloceanibacter sp.]GFO82523.1 MAG: glutaminase [Methyloceanibacter sp.]HML90795.1 glutaminase [Methyloceanibacter sp.]